MTAYVVAGAAHVLAVDDQDVSPGVIGFLVVAALGVATWLLIRSMNRQIRKIDLPQDQDDTRDVTGTDRDLPDGPEPDGRGITPR